MRVGDRIKLLLNFDVVVATKPKDKSYFEWHCIFRKYTNNKPLSVYYYYYYIIVSTHLTSTVIKIVRSILFNFIYHSLDCSWLFIIMYHDYL